MTLAYLLSRRKNYPGSSSGSRAVRRAWVAGPTPGRGGPPNPAFAGNNYESAGPMLSPPFCYCTPQILALTDKFFSLKESIKGKLKLML